MIEKFCADLKSAYQNYVVSSRSQQWAVVLPQYQYYVLWHFARGSWEGCCPVGAGQSFLF